MMRRLASFRSSSSSAEGFGCVVGAKRLRISNNTSAIAWQNSGSFVECGGSDEAEPEVEVADDVEVRAIDGRLEIDLVLHEMSHTPRWRLHAAERIAIMLKATCCLTAACFSISCRIWRFRASSIACLSSALLCGANSSFVFSRTRDSKERQPNEWVLALLLLLWLVLWE